MSEIFGLVPSRECPEKRGLLVRLVYEWISRLDSVFLPGGGLEVPCELIREDIGGVVLPVYIYSRTGKASEELVLGIDPGERHVGVVVFVDGEKVVGETVSPEAVPVLVKTLNRLFERVTVYVGDYPCRGLEELNRVSGRGVVVKKVHERDVKKILRIVSEEGERLSRHVRDAYFLLLAGASETLRSRIYGTR